MFVRIKYGIGSPGKLWTGDLPESGIICEPVVFLKTCGCSATTKKLRFRNILPYNTKEELPLLHLSMGGVGSIVEKKESEYSFWNWSGRVGGYAFLDPLAVISGYVGEIPPAPENLSVHHVYEGETFSEFVVGGEPLSISVTKLSICPPCREKMAQPFSDYIRKSCVMEDIQIPVSVFCDEQIANHYGIDSTGGNFSSREAAENDVFWTDMWSLHREKAMKIFMRFFWHKMPVVFQ